MNNLLILENDVVFYNSISKEMQETYIKSRKDIYKDYKGLIELFPKLTKEILYERYNSLKLKINKNENVQKFIEASSKYIGLFTYLYDCIKQDKICKKLNIEVNEDPDLDGIKNNDKIVLRQHQKIGIENAINNKFNSGIHSSATGSGKSIMALCIINEYHKKYPKNTVMWLCERLDIPQKLFFSSKNNFNEENFKKWKDNDIINMDDFKILEYVYNKPDDWTSQINNYNGKKPLFIIINRAFMTTDSKKQGCKKKYQEIIKNQPRFIIIDECHSAMASVSYTLMLYAKYNYKAYIHGLSATPYRKGKTYTKIDIPLDNNNGEIKNGDNREKLLEIFHKKGNTQELNILSWYNLKDAIEDGVILEPVFHWFCIKNYVGKTKKDRTLNLNYSDSEIKSVMNILNTIIEKCAYKKCIIWCRFKNFASEWHDIFKKEKNKYKNLKNIDSFLDHSGVSNNDYDEYYYRENNALLFCAGMHREGSDIPNLSMCMFLDKVKDRGEIPFIQCIGRVLRLDSEGLKNNGHIIDCLEDDEHDTLKTKKIIDMILGYYFRLYEISKSDFIIATNNTINENKVKLYQEIMKTLKIDSENKKIYIKMKNDKKITIDMENIEYSSIGWDKIIPNFEKILKHTLILNDFEDYIIFRDKCRECNVKSKKDFFDNRKLYNLYYINNNDTIEKIDPKIKWSDFFDNWYSFLNISTKQYISTKEEWLLYCYNNNITYKNYYNNLEYHKCLPEMPEELYKNFTNLKTELKLNNNIKRR
jgi:ERCC4-related helicase